MTQGEKKRSVIVVVVDGLSAIATGRHVVGARDLNAQWSGHPATLSKGTGSDATSSHSYADLFASRDRSGAWHRTRDFGPVLAFFHSFTRLGAGEHGFLWVFQRLRRP